MLQQLFINFCIMVTIIFCGSAILRPRLEGLQTYRDWVVSVTTVVVCGITLMSYPLEISPGVILGFHPVPIAVAGLYLGVGGGFMAALPISLYRYFVMGGPGAPIGTVTPLLIALISGLLHLRDAYLRPHWQLVWRALTIFAIVDVLLPVLKVPDISWTIWPIATVAHAAGLMVCAQVIRTHLQARARLDNAREQARTDYLTGLFNLRALEETFSALPAAEESCLLLLDVDHFKQFNDRYGHLVGDQVLRLVADTINSHIREGDLATRYGGEEFAVLLRRCSTHVGVQTAERIRVAVGQLLLEGLPPTERVTVSGGIIALSGAGDLRCHFASADALLYEAKSQGRNRIVAAVPV